jgi:hypothetical protein
MVGVRASRRASTAMGLHASALEAPNAKYISTLSPFSLSVKVSNEIYIIDQTNCNSFNTWVIATTIPETVLPQSIPIIGTINNVNTVASDSAITERTVL